jgi:hypothetical protein
MKRTLSLIAALLFVCSSQAEAATLPVLIAQWGFDEMTGFTLIDSTSGGHDGTLIGAKRTTDRAPTGIGNLSSIHLDEKAWASAPHVMIDNHSFTISSWLKSTGSTTGQVWFSQGDVMKMGNVVSLRLNADESLNASFGNDDLTSAGNVFTLNDWHHVAFTFDASNKNRKIYVDGTEVATGTSSGAYVGKTGLVALGRMNTSEFGSEYWHGNIDDVRVYDQILSAESIKKLATAVSMPRMSSSSTPTRKDVEEIASEDSAFLHYTNTLSYSARMLLRHGKQNKVTARLIRRGALPAVSAPVASSSSSSRSSMMSSSKSSAMSSRSSAMSSSSKSSLSSQAMMNGNLYQVTSFQLHLRKDSRATAVNIVTLMPYTKVYLDLMLKNGWAKVHLEDGTVGYVNASFIEKIQ